MKSTRSLFLFFLCAGFIFFSSHNVHSESQPAILKSIKIIDTPSVKNADIVRPSTNARLFDATRGKYILGKQPTSHLKISPAPMLPTDIRVNKDNDSLANMPYWANIINNFNARQYAAGIKEGYEANNPSQGHPVEVFFIQGVQMPEDRLVLNLYYTVSEKIVFDAIVVTKMNNQGTLNAERMYVCSRIPTRAIDKRITMLINGGARIADIVVENMLDTEQARWEPCRSIYEPAPLDVLWSSAQSDHATVAKKYDKFVSARLFNEDKTQWDDYTAMIEFELKPRFPEPNYVLELVDMDASKLNPRASRNIHRPALHYLLFEQLLHSGDYNFIPSAMAEAFITPDVEDMPGERAKVWKSIYFVPKQ